MPVSYWVYDPEYYEPINDKAYYGAKYTLKEELQVDGLSACVKAFCTPEDNNIGYVTEGYIAFVVHPDGTEEPAYVLKDGRVKPQSSPGAAKSIALKALESAAKAA